MKKLLLLLTTVLLTAMSSLATTATLVTSDADLKDGASYIIACPSANYAMTGTIKTSKKASYFTHTTATISGNTLTVTDAMAVVVLEKSGANWKLKIGDQYMQCTAEKKIQLATTGTDATAATIDLKNTNGIIYFGASYGYLKCNSDKDQERFSPYKSGMKPVALYKIDDDGGDTEPQVVETPVFSVADGAVEKGTEVSISCATQSATIRYTTNGDDVTEKSDAYSTAIVINKAMTIKAKAFKDGMTASEQAVADYTLSQIDPEQPATSGTATFNFADPTTLNPPYTEDDATIKDQDNKYANVGGVTFSANGVTIVNNKESETEARMYLSTATAAPGWAYRVYKTSTTTIAVPANCKLTSIEFETQSSSHGTALGNATFSAGSYDKTSKTLTFDASANVNEVTITPLATIGFTKITVKYAAVASAPAAPVLTMPEGYNADTSVDLTNYSGAEKKYFEVKVSWPEGLTLHYKTKCRGTQLDGKTLEYSTEQLALDKEAAQKHQSALPELTYALTGDLTGTAAVSRSAGTNIVTFGFASQGTFECYVVDAAGNQSGTKKLQFTGKSTGVEDIVVDGENGEAVFYNLQGVRVANPAAGNLYIKVQGDKATKVLVK